MKAKKNSLVEIEITSKKRKYLGDERAEPFGSHIPAWLSCGVLPS